MLKKELEARFMARGKLIEELKRDVIHKQELLIDSRRYAQDILSEKDEANSTIKCLTLEKTKLENEAKHSKEQMATLYKQVGQDRATIYYMATRLSVEGK